MFYKTDRELIDSFADPKREDDEFAIFGIFTTFYRWWWVYFLNEEYFVSRVECRFYSDEEWVSWEFLLQNIPALTVGVLALLACENLSKADEVPAFFLKIAKNIPRVGRSEGYNDFLKSRRNIPQVSGYNSRAQVLIIETQGINFILFIPHSE